MAATALIETADLLPDGSARQLHAAAVEAILGIGRVHRAPDGTFLRHRGGGAATLSDLAWLALGASRAAASGSCVGDGETVTACLRIVRDSLGQILDSHTDPDNPGTYFDGGAAVPVLGLRTRDPFDTAVPSGVAVAGEAFLTAATVISATGDPDTAKRWEEAAGGILAVHGEVARTRPLQSGGWLSLGEVAARGLTRAVVSAPNRKALGRLRGQLDSAAVVLGAGVSGIRVDGQPCDDGPHVQICRDGVCGRLVPL
ncbi:hypothetical protein [Corynebacterium pygosceleis]|uniref:Uncharacterized protein n=1 Tax=Corynebacterium pygosceleis TaxID=2800406 RepID=A0A9Q4C813_9CORY|nr:hypothetical protein [Corynebacterium pygosceleis]MCK7637050.1 hypothetical protein [Corynebacterium pygosceleis]MCL0120178.1 hypothetical protein [Corynebacterium pygosceleis]MCX7443722.1 hypothetical protein [Corynebacterium pygosceleis]MCX7467803.1 hypothetical protein [Corynebacterium pygosceleis]